MGFTIKTICPLCKTELIVEETVKAKCSCCQNKYDWMYNITEDDSIHIVWESDSEEWKNADPLRPRDWV